MAIVAVILAGGVSQRMGQEKAGMYGGVERIQRCLADAGIERCVVCISRLEPGWQLTALMDSSRACF